MQRAPRSAGPEDEGDPGATNIPPGERAAGVAVIVFVAFTFLAFDALFNYAPRACFLLVQEDHAVEWATVFAELGAAASFGWLCRSQRRSGIRLPWFPLLVALFAITIAGEEISWGERLLGFRPSSFFLRHNAQQESNLHNLVREQLPSDFVISGLLLAYGVALPIVLALSRRLSRLALRLGVVWPGPRVAVAMGLVLAVNAYEPWDFASELGELTFAVALLAVPLLPGRGVAPSLRPSRPLPVLLGAIALVLALGALCESRPPLGPAGGPERVTAAGEELSAVAARLSIAWTAEPRLLPCGIHLRVGELPRDVVAEAVAALQAAPSAGSPEERRSALLDPWDQSYWVVRACEDGPGPALIYSFGPNRRRDSFPGRTEGDDLSRSIAPPPPETRGE